MARKRDLLVAATAAVLASCSSGADSEGRRPDPADSTSTTPSRDAAEQQTIRVFFPDGESTPPDFCSGVVAVERAVTPTRAVATAAMAELFKGPTDDERRRGLGGAFGEESDGIFLSVRVREPIAYVDLDDDLKRLGQVGTTCGTASFTAAVEATLKQFSTVQEVRYAVEGSPRAFYELVQSFCPEPATPGDRCDAEPFSA